MIKVTKLAHVGLNAVDLSKQAEPWRNQGSVPYSTETLDAPLRTALDR